MKILSLISVLISLFHLQIFTNVQCFDPIIQLPHHQHFKIWSKSRKIINVNDFGAIGNGLNNDTQAFRDAWAVACSYPSRSRIEIPYGNTYLVGPIDFAGPCRSKVTLRVSGTIIAPNDPDVWHGLNPRKWLYFHGVKHLTIDGGGVINGRGQEWWRRSCKTNITNPCSHAPTVLTFHKCKDLKMTNLKTLDSQQMHMAFTSCIRVKASKLKVIAPSQSPNTDGIHISASSKVDVTNCIIETGDDCVSIVSNSSRIRIRNTSCRAGHGISIGSLGKSNSWSQVTDVLVDGALLSNTENGMRIKTWQGGSGFAERITFRNILMENVSNPIIIDQYYCDSFTPCDNQTSAVKVSNISFVDIQGTSATEEAIRIACSDTSPCEDIYLENIHLQSYTGEITTAFCWNAAGSSLGEVHPPSCLACSDLIIKQRILPSNAHSSF
ncbi:galacturonan 1,4-alpha-galacturonidase [Ranunculus cassubicifolius]